MEDQQFHTRSYLSYPRPGWAKGRATHPGYAGSGGPPWQALTENLRGSTPRGNAGLQTRKKNQKRVGLIKHPAIRAQSGYIHCMSSFLEGRSNTGEGQETGLAQISGWEAAGASSPFLRGCSPGRKDGSAGPPLARLPPTLLWWLRGPSPGSRRGVRASPGTPCGKGASRRRASLPPCPPRGRLPAFRTMRGSFLLSSFFFPPSPLYTWL